MYYLNIQRDCVRNVDSMKLYVIINCKSCEEREALREVWKNEGK